MSEPTYAILDPHPALRPFVESFWVQEDWSLPPEGGHPPTRLLPGGSPDLVVYYGDPFRERVGATWREEPRAIVAGLRSRPVDLAATGRTGVLIVRFRPWGAAAFFDDLASWADTSVELDAVLAPALVRETVERVADGRLPEERVRPVEELLLGRLGQRRIDELARLAALRLWRGAGIPPVTRVASELGISRRHLSRSFRAAIGTTPKRFSAIARFQRAMADHRCGLAWTDVAAAGGFTDQAHLVKEVRRFAGTTPTRLDVETDSSLFRRFNGTLRDPEVAPVGDRRESGIYKTVYARAPSSPAFSVN